MTYFIDWEKFWQIAGVTGAVIFFGRFYVQWFWSEKLGRSVIPIIFWYMSVMGSLLLLAYGTYILSPVGVVSYGFNLLVYIRNLIHIWRRNGKLTPLRYYLGHALIIIGFTIACGVVAYVWYFKVFHIRGMERKEAVIHTFWILLGLIGQFLFALRFLIQWLVTELRQKSVIPPIFWYLSISASLLQMVSYYQQAEYLYAIGLATTLLIYIRNIQLLWKGENEIVANGVEK
ncbi:MAG: lipid-A-disaccharide synthase N-terminal domain-containing protein [Candidatus Hydrogenedentes bacterium]|nr:lipid-A-disaccharide synthase N-terminal domain-containing protein [Candidatus Hydrogenedentota bacterium]